jgi:hypothetical protein
MKFALFNDDIYRAGLGPLKHLDMFDHQNIFRLLVQDAHVLLVIARRAGQSTSVHRARGRKTIFVGELMHFFLFSAKVDSVRKRYNVARLVAFVEQDR